MKVALFMLGMLCVLHCLLPGTGYAQMRKINEGAAPDGYYNKFNTKNFHPGHLNGQGRWTASSTGIYEIKASGLNIIHSDGIGAVLHRPFNEGVITIKIKTGSKFIIGYHYQLNSSERLACWSADGKSIALGYARGTKELDTVSFKSVTLPKSVCNAPGYYYLRIAIGPINKKEQQTLWVWPENKNQSNYKSLEDDAGSLMKCAVNSNTDNLQEGYIQIGSLSGTTVIQDIRITDYNAPDNYLTKKALFIGNWFNTMQGLHPSPAALMSFTSGSEIRFKVKNTTSATISFLLSHFEKKPYQPYVDVQYRDLTTANKWSVWQRHQIPWVNAPDNADLQIINGLRKTHQYELRCTVDIYDGDSCWVYGVGAIVKDIKADRGAIIRPSQITGQPIIMALGNSITAGVRQYLTKSGAIDQPANLLSYNSYFHVACDSLNVIPYSQAFGGTGINKAWAAAGTPKSLTTIRYFKQGRRRHSIMPSLILLNEGTNDNIKDTINFEKGYLQLIDTLQAYYPQAQIALMIPFDQKFKKSIRKIGAAKHFKVTETSTWKLSYVDGVHPDSLSQRKAGDSLYHWIKNNIALRPPVKRNTFTPN